MTKFFHIVWWFFLSTSVFAEMVTTGTIREDNPAFTIVIQYPQGFSQPAINDAIQKYISEQKNNFLQSAGRDKELPTNVPGKDTLNITYQTMYQDNQAISILFNLSAFNRGAVHPNNTAFTFNFINGQSITLGQVFKVYSDYLDVVANLSRTQLFLKKDLDKHQIEEGTKPTAENYKLWYFTARGLAVVFDIYQVAAYVYGPQTVKIPKDKLFPLIKSDVAKAVWG